MSQRGKVIKQAEASTERALHHLDAAFRADSVRRMNEFLLLAQTQLERATRLVGSVVSDIAEGLEDDA